MNQTKREGSCPNQLAVWQTGAGRGGRGAHCTAAREPQHNSNSSLSKATQASFLQRVYGDKCSALSAKNVRAGRSAPRRLSISPILASAAPPKPVLCPHQPPQTPPAESTEVLGKVSPPACSRLLSTSTTAPASWHSLLLLPPKLNPRRPNPAKCSAKPHVIKRILSTFLWFLQHHLTVQK